MRRAIGEQVLRDRLVGQFVTVIGIDDESHCGVYSLHGRRAVVIQSTAVFDVVHQLIMSSIPWRSPAKLVALHHQVLCLTACLQQCSRLVILLSMFPQNSLELHGQIPCSQLLQAILDASRLLDICRENVIDSLLKQGCAGFEPCICFLSFALRVDRTLCAPLLALVRGPALLRTRRSRCATIQPLVATTELTIRMTSKAETPATRLLCRREYLRNRYQFDGGRASIGSLLRSAARRPPIRSPIRNDGCGPFPAF